MPPGSHKRELRLPFTGLRGHRFNTKPVKTIFDMLERYKKKKTSRPVYLVARLGIWEKYRNILESSRKKL